MPSTTCGGALAGAAGRRGVAWHAGPSHAGAVERFRCRRGDGLLRERMASGQPFSELDVLDGSERWTLRGLPLLDAQGRPAGYVGTAARADAELAAPGAGGRRQPGSQGRILQLLGVA